MIPDLKQRRLTWYFENCWLPAHRDRLHGSMIAVVRETVADFVRFADVDPLLIEISDDSLTGFEAFSRLQRYSATVAKRRRERIESIVRHALPAADRPVHAASEPGDGTLRAYVRDVLPQLKPELRPKTLVDYAHVVNLFVRWLGEDIAVADVSPEMITDFEASTRRNVAYRLRTLMRTFDPMRFKMRSPKTVTRLALDTGNGSEFLLANVYERHYEPTALRSRRPNTKRLYRTTLLMLDRFLGRSATLDDLTDETVSAFAAWRLQKIGKHTVNKDLFNLLALWRWCHRKGMVEKWPDVDMEQAPRRTPVAWTEQEMRLIYRTIVELKGHVGKLPAADWWAALLLVVWDTGERINAVLNLSWQSVDLRRKWVWFIAENRKGGRDDSAVRLSDDAVAALRKIRAKDGPVFPWPYSYTYLWNRYSRILQKAGLPTDSKSKFHRIRKTVASYAEAAGADATKMLRHSKREITEAYLDPKIATRQQPVDVLFRLTDGKKK